MADEQINMPSGMGGITRYFDEYNSKVQIKPEYVVVLICAFILFEIIVSIV